jgi:hypothetical protein
MSQVLAYTMAWGLLWASVVAAAENDTWRAAPLGTPPITEENDPAPRPGARIVSSPSSSRDTEPGAVPAGRPENRWRYRFASGRWWYWTPDLHWSYFDGSRWVAYRGAGGFSAEKVDPALLQLEAKEGVLGTRKWGHPSQAGGGWIMSGTRGSMGGASSVTAPGAFGPSGGMGGGWSGGWQSPGGAPRGR